MHINFDRIEKVFFRFSKNASIEYGREYVLSGMIGYSQLNNKWLLFLKNKILIFLDLSNKKFMQNIISEYFGYKLGTNLKKE